MKKQKIIHFRFITKYLKRQKFMVFMLLLVSLLNIGMQLINPQISRYFLDEAQVGHVGKNLIFVAVMYIMIAFIAQGFSLLVTYFGQKIGWKATNDIRVELIDHCIGLDMSFHKEHKAGELIQRVDGDVSQLFELYSSIIISLFNTLLLLFGVLFCLYRENIFVGAVFTLFSIFAVCTLWMVKYKTESIWVKESQINAEFYGFIGETISSTEDISKCGAIKYIMNKFYNIMREMCPIFINTQRTWGILSSATKIIFAVGNIVAFSIALNLWNKGLIKVGTVYLIFNYIQSLKRPIEELNMNVQQLQLAGASVVRVSELFNIKSKVIYGNEKLQQHKPLELEFNNVGFQYEDGNNVLNNISFKIKSGHVLGILGHTGSGKTTIARLVSRLYDVKSGEILINNKNIKLLREEELINNIVYITQDVQVFTATIRDNITMFNKGIDDDRILKVIYELGLDLWYEGLSKGLDTKLEMGGSNLSSGEAQILSFIRAFLTNPKIIVLDEATSRIDSLTEKLIENALDKLLKGRTCIIIAHKLSTLNRADDILILKHGEIAETGPRKKLLEDHTSQYYKLTQKGISEVLT